LIDWLLQCIINCRVIITVIKSKPLLTYLLCCSGAVKSCTDCVVVSVWWNVDVGRVFWHRNWLVSVSVVSLWNFTFQLRVVESWVMIVCHVWFQWIFCICVILIAHKTLTERVVLCCINRLIICLLTYCIIQLIWLMLKFVSDRYLQVVCALGTVRRLSETGLSLGEWLRACTCSIHESNSETALSLGDWIHDCQWLTDDLSCHCRTTHILHQPTSTNHGEDSERLIVNNTTDRHQLNAAKEVEQFIVDERDDRWHIAAALGHNSVALCCFWSRSILQRVYCSESCILYLFHFAVFLINLFSVTHGIGLFVKP